MFLTSNDVILVNPAVSEGILFDNVVLSEEEQPNPVPSDLIPNEKQQDNFIRNCIKAGILKIK